MPHLTLRAPEAQLAGREAALIAALTDSGIDAKLIAAKSQDPVVKNRLMQLTQDAVDRGAFGSPTFFVNDELFFGKDQLRDVEEEIISQKTRASAPGESRSKAAG